MSVTGVPASARNQPTTRETRPRDCGQQPPQEPNLRGHLACNPGTSSSEPIDIGAAREAFTQRIDRISKEGRWGHVTEVDEVLIGAVTKLFDLLEHETRRIDNEVTEAVTDSGNA